MAKRAPSGPSISVHVDVKVVDRAALLGAMVTSLSNAQCRKAAYEAKRVAQDLVPVKTGALKGSIRVQRYQPGVYELQAGGGEVDYAAYVEFGTAHMAARPYFTPAIEAGRKVMLAKPEKRL